MKRACEFVWVARKWMDFNLIQEGKYCHVFFPSPAQFTMYSSELVHVGAQTGSSLGLSHYRLFENLELSMLGIKPASIHIASVCLATEL